jgi:hypothetical protein
MGNTQFKAHSDNKFTATMESTVRNVSVLQANRIAMCTVSCYLCMAGKREQQYKD